VTSCDRQPDADGDGHSATSCGGDDCDDSDPMRFPGRLEVCDENHHDDDCDATTFGTRDDDGDGFTDARCCNTGSDGTSHCGNDCDDSRRSTNPNTAEACDGIDNNCNGMIDEGTLVAAFIDADRDLHGDPAHPIMACAGRSGVSPLGDDCDDADPSRHPAQPEICDGVDNDCNGAVDDDTRAVTWYADNDGDGFGDATGGTAVSCEPVAGYAIRGGDCDDARRTVSPAAAESCNGRDDDCNGTADFEIASGDGEDDDGDGAADSRCPGVGSDCDDRDATVRPGAVEICDGRDNDCNGMIDDGATTISWYLDADGDGYGSDAAPPVMSCTRVAGRVSRSGDCDDHTADRHPNLTDACNGLDDDCD
jgi:hypothetical protein